MKLSRFLGIVGVLSIVVSSSLSANWQTDPFIRSVERSGKHYSFEFWVRGLDSVSRVQFDDDSTASFKPFWNKMVLGSSHSDGAERIRSWQRLSPIDLGILAHESFHAYVRNFIFRHKDWAREREWMEVRAPIVFNDLRPGKAVVAMEEAYAWFIGNVITAARTTEQIYQRRTDVPCEKNYSMLKRIWERSWQDEVNGYYYRDSIGEYWVDRVHWIAEKLGAEGDTKPGEPIFTELSITSEDRNWISKNIFEGRLTSNFDESFPSISQELKDCAGQSEESLDSQSE